jgi:hypothetical protein
MAVWKRIVAVAAMIVVAIEVHRIVRRDSRAVLTPMSSVAELQQVVIVHGEAVDVHAATESGAIQSEVECPPGSGAKERAREQPDDVHRYHVPNPAQSGQSSPVMGISALAGVHHPSQRVESADGP